MKWFKKHWLKQLFAWSTVIYFLFNVCLNKSVENIVYYCHYLNNKSEYNDDIKLAYEQFKCFHVAQVLD